LFITHHSQGATRIGRPSINGSGRRGVYAVVWDSTVAKIERASSQSARICSINASIDEKRRSGRKYVTKAIETAAP
jgi:hypothetical protein